MVYKVIKTEEEYNLALVRLKGIFDAEVGTPEGDELEMLSKKRKLSLDMIRRVNRDLHIPTAVFVQDY